MKIILLILALIISIGYSKSLSNKDNTNKTFGGKERDEADSIIQIKDGGFIIAGGTESFGNGGYDAYLIKIDKKGNKIWEKTFGGKYNDILFSIVNSGDGGFIVAGGTESFGNRDYDAYLIKLDKNGNKIWEKTFGGKDNDMAFSIVNSSDGGFIVVGGTFSFGKGEEDLYLIKIDKNGNKIWEKTFGGKEDEMALSIVKSLDGGFIVAGYTKSFGHGKKDTYLIKIDKNGNKIWEKTFGGKDLDWANKIIKSKGGGLIVAGETWSFGHGKGDAYLIKIDKNGNKIWQKTFGGKKSDEAIAISQIADSKYIVIGYTKSFGNGKSNVYIINTEKYGNNKFHR